MKPNKFVFITCILVGADGGNIRNLLNRLWSDLDAVELDSIAFVTMAMPSKINKESSLILFGFKIHLKNYYYYYSTNLSHYDDQC